MEGVAKSARASRGRRGLRKLPPELVAQAQEQTAATITRIMLTFVGLVLFCLLSLLTPDTALLTGGERLNVPFAGPVSFRGLIIIGPAILIVLRVYLQIYVEHYRRLEPIRRQVPSPWVPTVAPLQNPLLRVFVGFVLYLLLPLTMLAFTWKAAILPGWGAGLLCITVAVTAGHLVLRLRWGWRSKALVSGSAAILAAGMVAYSESPVSRPANLFRADLSNQFLVGSALEGANLKSANLEGANLEGANLEDANLGGANLEDANLGGANLGGANLLAAQLGGAYLWAAQLGGANLLLANLEGAVLGNANLEDAVLGNANLEGADLWGAKLGGAVLGEANLKGADLGGADLESADLGGADLGGANLEGARLRYASLRDANLEGADLVDAAITQAQLDQACGDETTKLPEGLSIGPCAH